MAYTQTQLEPVIGTCLSLVPFQLSLSLSLPLSLGFLSIVPFDFFGEKNPIPFTNDR